MSLKHRDSKKKKKSKPNKKWFDKDCYTERKELKFPLNVIKDSRITGTCRQNTLSDVRHITDL